ncbi:MAG: hypothetical protein LBR16_07045 [Treponema sp.]|jgi:hypothetical protein|nr:hypothetical protein [Treponema sp.]
MKKTLILFAASAALFSCGRLDVVGKESAAAFGRVLDGFAPYVTRMEAGPGWSLTAPDGSARFVWGAPAQGSGLDAWLAVDAAPFLAAGLSPALLPQAIRAQGGTLVVGTALTPGAPAPAEDSPLAAFRQIVSLNRQAIGYHAALDHYNVALGGGFLFEWARDPAANDKDIVFVLAPEPFAAAGADLAAIAGWTYAPVTVDDDAGRPVEVYKLLKPFDLAAGSE